MFIICFPDLFFDIRSSPRSDTIPDTVMKRFRLPILLIAVLVARGEARMLHIGAGQPYANIEAAAAAALAGDTIAVHAGSYAAYQYVTDLHGTPAQSIVITRYASDAMEISGMWQFSRCSYLAFSKLVFRATPAQPGRLFHIDNGGSCATQSHHIDVDSCSFLDVSDPANSALKYGGVDFFTVRNCLFRNIAAGAFDFNACHDGSITGNHIEQCATGGHIKGGASQIRMERNLFLNAAATGWVAFEFGGDTGTQYYCPGSTAEVNDLQFYSNIVVGGYRGLALSSAVHCDVANNTFYECGQATMRFLTTSNTFPALAGNTVRNNIFAFGAASQYMNGSLQSAGAVTFEGNIYCSTSSAVFNGPYWDSPALDAIKDPKPLIFASSTPMFVNGVSGDFHLAAGSPAIATGAAGSEPVLDFYGKPFAARRAIGAAEYPSGTSGVETLSLSTLAVYPNPAVDYIIIQRNAETAPAMETNAADICTVLGIVVAHVALNGIASGTACIQQIPIAALPAGMYLVRTGGRAAMFMKAPPRGR